MTHRYSENGIVLLYGWSAGNAGDEAITPGTVCLLRSIAPHLPITVVANPWQGADELAAQRDYLCNRFDGVTIVSDDWTQHESLFRNLPKRSVAGILRALKDKIKGRDVRAIFQRSSLGSLIRTSRAVVLNGGHLFFWSSRMQQKVRILQRYLYPLERAITGRIPTFLLGQSFGPFEFEPGDHHIHSRFSRCFRNASFVQTRESESARQLEGVSRCLSRCIGQGLDMAFFDAKTDLRGAESIMTSHSLSPRSFVVVTTRLTKRGSQVLLPTPEREEYAKKISSAIDIFRGRNDLRIVFVTQVPKDEDDAHFVLRYVSDETRRHCIVTEHISSPEILRGFYEQAVALVGMRFHSMVFALTMRTPVIGVSYYDIGPKIRGLMEDIEMGAHFHDLRDSTAEAICRSIEVCVAEREARASFASRFLTCKAQASVSSIEEAMRRARVLPK